MTRHLVLLTKARDALLSARPRDCERAMSEFEALYRRIKPDADTNRACHERLEELRQLVRANIEGVASARQALAEAVESVAQLSLYDASGERETKFDRRKPGPSF